MVRSFFLFIDIRKVLLLFFIFFIIQSSVAIEELNDKSDIFFYPNTKKINFSAKQIIVIDFLTQQVLLSKNPNQKMTPSSMTKIMTSYVIEEKIQTGEYSFDSEFLVSEKAWKFKGSKTFVPLGKKIKLKDILYGIIIQSGNDASIVAAEGIAGKEEEFVKIMNKTAISLGMRNTNFTNSTGWPEKNHYTTAYDLAILAVALIRNHSEFYYIYGLKEFSFGFDIHGNPIKQYNRNPLLGKNLDCDGIKTGNTELGGYGLVASFLDKGRRYIIVINGLKSIKARAKEALMILEWVKEHFVIKSFYKKGEVVINAMVKLGKKQSVDLVASDDLSVLINKFEINNIKIKLDIKSPIYAPIYKGDVLGKIIIILDNRIQSIDLIAKEKVLEVNLITRIYYYFLNLISTYSSYIKQIL